MVDCETMFAAKALVTALGGTLFEGRQTGLDYDVTSLSAVNFNTGIAEAENADEQDHVRSEEHTSELQSLMRISYAVICLKKKKIHAHQLQKNIKIQTETPVYNANIGYSLTGKKKN